MSLKPWLCFTFSKIIIKLIIYINLQGTGTDPSRARATTRRISCASPSTTRIKMGSSLWWKSRSRKINFSTLYRVSHLVIVDLGLVDFDLSVPPFCLAAKPLQSNSRQPWQSREDSGTMKIQVDQTKSTTRWDALHFVKHKWDRPTERFSHSVAMFCYFFLH